MVRNIHAILLAFMVFSGSVLAQGAMGELKGTISDEKGEPMPFANVVLMKEGFQFRGSTTDINGTYWMKAIPAGAYNIVVSSVGYHTVDRKVVVESGGNITFFNYKMITAATDLGAVDFVVEGTDVPLIRADETMVRTTIRREDILKLPSRDPISAATTVGGVFSRDGEVGNFRGSRQGATIFIDGVRIRGGSARLPQQSVEETQVILGGVPAQFGDATGGLILLTTRGISNKFFGAVEGRTSKFLDRWDDALFSAVVGGPLAFRKDTTQKNGKRPVLGFLTAIEGNYSGDPSPVANGVWRVKESVRDNIIANPIRLAETGSGSRLNAEYLRMGDFERLPVRTNMAAQTLNWQGKIDYQLGPRTQVTAGGYINAGQNRGGRDGGTYGFSLFNWENNREVQNFTWNVWGRITQRFEGDTSGRGIKNALLSLQVDYLNGRGLVQDPRHGNNFFNYGYVGRFTPYRAAVYPTFGFDAKSQTSGWLFAGFQDTLIGFEPGAINPLSSAITSQYYTLFNTARGFYDEFPSIQNGGGLLNGQAPRSVYDLWSHVGTPFNGYEKNDNNQFRAVGQGSATIKNHDIQIGFEFDQRTDNFYSIAPVGLWRIAWLQTNSHLGQIDTANPQLVYDSNGMFADTINYPFLYREDELRTAQTGYKFGVGQSFFDWNLRQRLGLAADGLDFVDVDRYDPSFYDVSMFSADELLNQGSNLVTYYGYDVYGNKLGGNVGFDEFFTARDQFGNFTRPIGSFQPIYLAGYISDKFSFKDIIFNVGVRVDRFDANQQVLKDRFSLYQTRTRGEVENLAGNPVLHPGNIGENYVVYVNDRDNPTEVLGYRDGMVWYNAQGQVINDPALLRTASGRVQPLMVNPSDDIQSQGFSPSGSFIDYEPQINVMPRVSFSFPISDNVGFTAYYDVLTQRPSAAVRLNPLDYFYWDNTSYNNRGRFFNNPSLRPERTTDFSLGFRQKVTPFSALRISAFYRELRDMIALIQVNEAYPRTYGTWDNIDFGTVKGVTFEYELRRSRTFSLTATYTLQFADGTGSDNVSQLNLVNSGQPNLRTTIPVNYDRRHLFTAFAIYRVGGDSLYKGPRSLRWLLENFGASATLRGGSGVPFSRQSNVTGTQLGGGFGQPSLDGSINGARLPWEFNIDLMLDKDITIKWGKVKEGSADERKKSTVNIYCQVLNVFDFQNTINVYGATGNPDDDGFLDAPQFQPFINGQVDPQAFRDYYSMRVNDPRNLSLPRRIRVGAILNF
jgi:hypothetical protein